MRIDPQIWNEWPQAKRDAWEQFFAGHDLFLDDIALFVIEGSSVHVRKYHKIDGKKHTASRCHPDGPRNEACVERVEIPLPAFAA